MVIFIIIVDELGQIVEVKWCSPQDLIKTGISLHELVPSVSKESISDMLLSLKGDAISSLITQLLFEDKVIPLTLYALSISDKMIVIGFDNGTTQSKVYDEFISIYNDFANKVREEFNSAIKIREESIKNQFEEIQKLNNELINAKRTLEKNNFQINSYNFELKKLYEKLDGEIDKAKNIHEDNLPQALPEIKGVSIAPYYQPAYTMGGDYYNAVLVGEDKLVFYVSDVSGHNLDGAIMSVFVKITINNYLALASYQQITPSQIIKFVFEQYNKENYPEDYFICLQVCVLELKNYQLTYTASGFNYPGFCCVEGRMIPLESGGLPISSAYPIELLSLQENSLTLTPTSTILILTDGLFEAEKDGQQYGVGRIEQVFAQNYHKPPEIIRDSINNDFFAFNSSLKSQDDITYLLVQIKK